MLGAFVVMTVAGAPAELAAEMDVNTETGPNIVVFVSDDMGWGQAGFNGGTDIATTNLDRIADEGVRLTQFYVQPACAPTRASLFTGRYAWKTGAGSNPDSSSDDGLLLDERTIAEALRDSGYATWLVGKWHLGTWGSERLPLQRGFEHHYGFYNGFIDSYELLRPWRYWHEIFDWHRNGRPVVESGYSTFLLAEEASQLIERHNGSRPFFLYVAFNAPHDPYQAPRKYIRQVAPSVSSGEERKQRAMVKAMDDAIGQVMDALDRKDVLDETLVMFLNDNGGTSEAGGNSPYQGLKRSYLEGGIRVPAVMRWPGRITAASENDSLMHVSDLFPTFAGLAGADTGGGLPLDGFDAWEAIANGAESPREEVVHSLDVIRVGDWKLLEEDGAFSKGNQSSPEQLYNIADDPYETTNLASSETAKVAELQERLAYHRPFARDAQPGAAIPGLDGPQSLLADDRPVMFGEEENTAFGAEVETALTQREAGNLGPKLLWIEASGDQVKMVYDETLAADSVPPADAFKVVVNPGYTSAEVTAVEVGESEVLLTLAQSVRSGETAGLTYEVPDTGAIRDVDGIAAVGVTWVRSLAEVSITAASSPVTEGTVAAFNVSLSSAASEVLTVAVSVTESGSMLSGIPPASVAFSPGDTSVTLSVPTAADSVVEADSVVAAAVATGTGYTVDTASSATVTVEDDDAATFTVTAAPAAIDEGESATLTVAIANGVTLAEVQTVALAVTGTASASDYTGVPAALTLAAGASSATADLTASDDQEEEADETLTVEASLGGVSIGTATVTIASVSHDATLSALSLSGIDIGTFSSTVTSYAASVGHGVESTTVTATASHPEAEVSIAPGAAVSLAAGANQITVTVTAANGATTATYAVAVTRAASSDATLNALSLSSIDIGTFDGATLAYEATVAHNIGTTTVAATATDATASVVIADARGSTEGSSREVSLAVGRNEITVTVTAADGTTTATYAVGVTRATSSDATLSDLTLSGIELGGFASATTSYAVSVPHETATTTVAGTTANAAASIAIADPQGNTAGSSRVVSLAVWRTDITLTVTAADGMTTRTYSVAVERGGLDIDALAAAGNRHARGLWGNGEVLWVTDYADSKLYAYDQADGGRLASRDIATWDGATRNEARYPTDAWSDGETVWVSDNERDRVYAYRLSDGRREPGRDPALAAGNRHPNGVWGDGETLWAMDDRDAWAYAYRLSDGTRDTAREFAVPAGANRGLWSDGTTYWSADWEARRALAFRNGGRAAALDIDLTRTAFPSGLWSDGRTVWVADYSRDRLDAYRLPAVSSHAALVLLRLAEADLGAFSPTATAYAATVAHGTARTTLAAHAVAGATLAYSTADADPAAGHQVDLAVGANAIDLTVTAADGTTKRTYAVTVERAAAGTDDATLTALTLSGIDLGTFAADTTSYGVAVANDVLETTVTATPTDAGARVTIADADGSTTGTSRNVSLSVGAQTVTVTATARDGVTTRTYTVTVERAAVLLTAAFEDVPAGHDGSNAFALTLRFSEALAAGSAAKLRGGAAAVANGTLSSARRIDGDRAAWSLAVVPSGTDDVTVSVSAGAACDADGVCTADGRPLSARAAATVAGPGGSTNAPLTASFEDVPVGHDGATGFSFALRFSEPVGTSFRTLRDESLVVVGGTATRARRVNGNSAHWSITVRPAGPDDVAVRLPTDVACDAGGVCTADDRRLSNALSATVAGPASAVVFADAWVSGPLVTLRYDAALDGGSTPAPADFAVLASRSHAVAQVPASAVRVAADTVLLVLARPVQREETVTLSYLAAPMHPVQDAAGRAAAPLADVAVRNDTPAAALGAGAAGEDITVPPSPAAPPGTAPDLSPWLADGGASAPLGRLDLSGRVLPDPAALATLTGLRELNLGDNAVADLAPLSGLTGLRVLDLSSNAVADVGPLAALTGLERLDLSGNRIADVSALSGLTGLEVLVLNGNRIDDVLPLWSLQRLVHLGLADNRVADIGLLAGLGSLKRLDLSGNRVSDVSPLGDLSELVWLRLPGNPVSDAAPLGRLAKLRWLWLDAEAGGAGLLEADARQLWIEVEVAAGEEASILRN